MIGEIEGWQKRESSLAIGILLLALLLRVGFVIMQRPGFYFEDSLEYDRAARTLLETGHFDHKYHRPPTYPLLMALCYKVFGAGPMPFRMLQAILGTINCFVIWRLARGMFGWRTGLLSLLLAGVFPPHVVLVGIEYPTLVGMLMIWVGLWMLCIRTRSGAHQVLSLLAVGMTVAIVCQIFLAGFALAVFMLLWILLENGPLRQRIRNLGVLSLAAAAMLGPWMYRMGVNGDFRPFILKIALHLPRAPGVIPPPVQGNGWNLLEAKVKGLMGNPGWTLRRQAREFANFWNPYPAALSSASMAVREMLHKKDPRMEVVNPLVGQTARWLYAFGFGMIMVIAVVGAMAAWYRTPGIGILVGWPIVLALCYAPFLSRMRYRIPADPALIILAAYAVDAAISRTLGKQIRAFGRTLLKLGKSPG